ncbi:MAG: hypothetical protein ACOYO1_01610 [Bacteroidales bacterium]
MNYKKIDIIYLIFFLITLLSSCSAERELAREFVKTKKDIPILLYCTDKLVLTNDKLKKIINFDSLDVSKQDSLWTAKTLYLDSVNDVKLLNKFYTTMKSELQSYGFLVFTNDSIDKFNSLETSKYSLNIAQVEISEDDYIYRDQEVFPNSLVYYHDNTLNLINLNLWFEFSSTGFKTEKVFYSSFPLNDQLESRFIIDNNTDKVSYQYKITPFNLNDIYQLCDFSAKKSTNYLFNFLMNKYVKDNLPSNVAIPKYFSFDHNTGFLYSNSEDRFEELNSN